MGSDTRDLREDAAELTAEPRVEVLALTHRGRVRKRNEDTVALPGWVSSEAMAEPYSATLDLRSPRLLLVADGMGGHAAGEVASRFAVTRLGGLLEGVEPAEDTLVEAIQDVNRQLYERMASDPALTGMGTTLVGLWIGISGSFLFNIGDSRCYLVRGDELTQLSEDDTPERGAGGAGGGRTGRRSGIVTQALGGGAALRNVEPHVRRIERAPGVAYLLCSDGLTDMVPVRELARAFGADPASGTDPALGTDPAFEADPALRVDRAERTDPPDLRETATALLQRALAAGGVDNISIVLARHTERAIAS